MTVVTELNPILRGWMAYQSDRNQAGAGRVGRLDQAQTALHSVAAVETSLYSRQELDEGRTDGRLGVSLGLQPTWAMVK